MTIDLFCLLIFTFSVMEIQLRKVNAHFSWSFTPICMYGESIGVKMFNYFAQLYLCNGKLYQ